MTLEFEKLMPRIDEMAKSTAKREKDRKDYADDLLEVMETYKEEWTAVENALALAEEKSDPKLYRSARPLNRNEPLNAAIPAPIAPLQATIISTDGSQIMPDRHAAYLYYLINVGGIIYYHGSGRTPDSFSNPELKYPANDVEAARFALGAGGDVSVERDLKEIGTLADVTWRHRDELRPLMAILDQRLLYWPIGGEDDKPNVHVRKWLAAMTKVHDSGGLLAGYIDRPMTPYVATLLRTLQGAETPQTFAWKELGKRGAGRGLEDAALFSRFLNPGERSAIFTTISPHNTHFADDDPANEVCFFYMNPAQYGRSIARVDIPMWVAEDAEAVTAVHALVYDQCQILGDYPYVIARADEMAVVGRRDNEELNAMIDLKMQEYGVSSRLTAKQGSKGLARGGKTRHKGL